MSDPHFAFIFASYAVTVVVIGGVIAWTVADYRRLRAALARLPSRERESGE